MGERPSLEQLRDEGYRDLNRGLLKTALDIARKGQKKAEENHLPAWSRIFRVLEAEVLVGQRRIDEALITLGPVLEKSKKPDLVYTRAIMTRAHAWCQSPDEEAAFKKADLEFVQAWDIALSAGAIGLMGEIAQRRGNCRLLANHPVEAEGHFRQALEFARREKLVFQEVHASGSIGLLKIFLQKFDEATDWLEQSLDLIQGLKADNLLCKLLGNLGWCYFMSGDYERALPHLFKCQSLAQELGLFGDRMIVLANIGNIYVRKKSFDLASEYYNQALKIAKDLKDRAWIGILLGNLAEMALEKQLWDQAGTYATQALKTATDLGSKEERLRMLLVKSKIYIGRGQYKRAQAQLDEIESLADAHSNIIWRTKAAEAQLNFVSGDYEKAESAFRSVLAMREKIWKQLRDAEHRIPFFTTIRRLYEDYVDMLVMQGRIEQALLLAENSRARLVRELLGQNKRKERFSSQNFQSLARSVNSVFLVYWVASKRSYLWIVSDRVVRLQILPGEDEITRDIDIYMDMVLRSRDLIKDAAPIGIRLWKALIAPGVDQLPRGVKVMVVPDGPLHRLNLETLIVPEPQPHYWIEDAKISMVPSLLLLDVEKGVKKNPSQNMLLIGDPLPANNDYPRLVHAAAEIEKIGGLFESKSRSVYTGEVVDPDVYRDANPGRFDYLHIVTHIMPNHENPLESALIVSKKGEKYRIYAKELLDVPLRADLVTLSGCQSAGSRAFSGEGLVGLTWALMVSGAKKVVGGLWNVEDASSSQLMVQMYTGLQKGLDPLDALRNAKLALLQSDTAYRKPYYWAPFLLFVRKHIQ